jgi:predicted dehydrogenase
VGVLGAGAIAQFAHLEACRKARNVELHAICDRAEDLLQRVATAHPPRTTYTDYDAMLADPDLDAVIVAVADQFHVAAARQAVAAGKHVLVENPNGLADTVLDGAPLQGADVDDGLSAMRVLAAISQSTRTGETVRVL